MYSGALGFDDFNHCIDDEYLALFVTVESIYKVGVGEDDLRTN